MKRPSRWKAAGRASTIGIEICVALVVGILGGDWLDSKLGTRPWLFWIGLIVGITAASRLVWRAAKDLKL